MRKELATISLSIILSFPACGLFAAEELAPQTQAPEKAVQITAEKVVLNVNGALASDVKGEGRKDSAASNADVFDLNGSPLFKGDFMSLVDKFASWDGFRPWKIIYLLCGFVIALILSRFSRWLLESYLKSKLAKRTETDLDDMLCHSLGRPASLLVFTILMYASFLPIMKSMPENIGGLCGRLFLAFGAASVAWSAYRLSELLSHVLAKLAASTDNTLDDLVVGIVRKMAKVCVVFVSVLFIGQNILGLNITTLLAGAGVAGLAIAFAAQDSIANFFGSLMIILDRPFSVGDYVRIDSFEGTIERVGLRSSALRTKDGHLITIPNKQAANSSIVNISARPYIRNVVNLGLVYDTPPEKMEEAMKILQRLLHRHEGFDEMHPAKINFTEFKDFSLNIEVVIWYHPGDYFQCREWMSKFNMEVLRSFNEAGLEFAFPTSTNYLASDSKRGLKVIQDVEQGG